MLFNFIPKELDHLKLSKFDFFLTGSRFFKRTAQEDTDWNFYAEYSAEAEVYLRSEGYLLSGEYVDVFTLKVFTKKTSWIKIDVQLVEDTHLKTRAQELLAPYLKSVPKEYHKVLWNLAFTWLQSN